ncbi:unnamed protein product [Dicrocoelium dendriticum]|nr:unnamed protein product [Dicrocoelium dendriticum]
MLYWDSYLRQLHYRTRLLLLAAFGIMSLFLLSYIWLPDASTHAQLEKQNHVRQMSIVHSFKRDGLNDPLLNSYDRLNGTEAGCVVRIHQMLSFPDCLSKIEWLKTHWESHPCYAKLGVDGSECSVLRYLSEIEGICPVMENRKQFSVFPNAYVNYDLDALLRLIPQADQHHSSITFMRTRLKRLWPEWTNGMREYESWNDPVNSTSVAFPIISPSDEPILDCIPYDERELRITRHPHLLNRPALTVHLHLGFLSTEINKYFDGSISKGGPLGEVLQWTDLLAGLFILGHNVSVSMELQSTLDRLQVSPFLKTPCQVGQSAVDLIYTDIVGFRQLQRAGVRVHRCKYRILDSFGTEATFNRNKESAWGGLHLNLQQFYTLFPHSPDNTFLGFVAEQLSFPGPPIQLSSEKPRALIYGKQAYMWKNANAYLKVLSEFFTLQSNVADARPGDLPEFVINHAVSYGEEYLKLLKSCRVMIGLGFPYEGPAPLEAIVNGIVFVNPRFDPPHDRHRTAFFKDKPTSRKVTSQQPYLEQYVGEPYSYLVNMHNESDVRQTMVRLLSNLDKVRPFPIFEFSAVGFIERLNALLQHQRFCDSPSSLGLLQSPLPLPDMNDGHFRTNLLEVNRNVVMWPPPLTALRIIFAMPGQSCTEACMARGRSTVSILTPSSLHPITSEYLRRRSLHFLGANQLESENNLRCAPEHFSTVNNRFNLERLLNFSCPSISILNSTTAPHWDSAAQSCVFQASRFWFDCTSTPTASITRFCPCRDILPGQLALCATCV